MKKLIWILPILIGVLWPLQVRGGPSIFFDTYADSVSTREAEGIDDWIILWRDGAKQCSVLVPDDTASAIGSGDITAVNAGNWLTGGGEVGDVTLYADSTKIRSEISDTANVVRGEYDTQGEVETIWGITLATDTEAQGYAQDSASAYADSVRGEIEDSAKAHCYDTENELTTVLDDNYNWFTQDSIDWDTLNAYPDTGDLISPETLNSYLLKSDTNYTDSSDVADWNFINDLDTLSNYLLKSDTNYTDSTDVANWNFVNSWDTLDNYLLKSDTNYTDSSDVADWNYINSWDTLADYLLAEDTNYTDSSKVREWGFLLPGDKVDSAVTADSAAKMDTTYNPFQTYVTNHAGEGHSWADIGDTCDAHIDAQRSWSAIIDTIDEYDDDTQPRSWNDIGDTADAHIELRRSWSDIGDTCDAHDTDTQRDWGDIGDTCNAHLELRQIYSDSIGSKANPFTKIYSETFEGTSSTAYAVLDSADFNHLVVNANLSFPANSIDTGNVADLATFVQNNDDNPRAWGDIGDTADAHINLRRTWSDIADTCDAHDTQLDWADVGDTCDVYANSAKAAIRDTVEAIVGVTWRIPLFVEYAGCVIDTNGNTGHVWIISDKYVTDSTNYQYFHIRTDSSSAQRGDISIEWAVPYYATSLDSFSLQYQTGDASSDSNQIDIVCFENGQTDSVTASDLASTSWTTEMVVCTTGVASFTANEVAVIELQSTVSNPNDWVRLERIWLYGSR